MFRKALLSVALLFTFAFVLFAHQSNGLPAKAAAPSQSSSPLNVYFDYYPYDPSTVDTVYFNSYVWCCPWYPISYFWEFGDGSTATGQYVPHRYTQDGNYVVKNTVVDAVNSTGSVTRTVIVKTYDVAITKFSRPKSVSVGQTKRLIVSVQNTRYPHDVVVQLLKGVPGGAYPYYNYQLVGTLQQYVVVNKRGTTDFYFSYTFTPEDGALGKVTFKAIAAPVNIRDAYPADNEFVAGSITVSSGGAKAASEENLDDYSDYVEETVSHPDESKVRLFLPMVKG